MNRHHKLTIIIRDLVLRHLLSITLVNHEGAIEGQCDEVLLNDGVASETAVQKYFLVANYFTISSFQEQLKLLLH